MKQTKADLEKFYETVDPWGFKTNPDDQKRKDNILAMVKTAVEKIHEQGEEEIYVLDIGCGEGFITESIAEIPHVDWVFGTELSDAARSRWNEVIKDLTEIDAEEFPPIDIVLTCGTLYKQYDTENIIFTINLIKPKVIIIAGISDWLIPCPFYDTYIPVHTHTFPYREYTQMITVLEKR